MPQTQSHLRMFFGTTWNPAAGAGQVRSRLGRPLCSKNTNKTRSRARCVDPLRGGGYVSVPPMRPTPYSWPFRLAVEPAASPSSPARAASARNPAPPPTGLRVAAVFCLFTLAACHKSSKNESSEKGPQEQPSPAVSTTDGQGAALVDGQPPPGSMGEWLRGRDYELMIRDVRRCQEDSAFGPAPGLKRIGVKLSLRASTEHGVPSNPFYALLTLESGARVEPQLGGCKPALGASLLTQGQVAEGFVSFDVPEGANEEATLRYAPVVVGVGQERLEVALGPLPR